MTAGTIMFFGGIIGAVAFLIAMFVVLGNRDKKRKKLLEKIQKSL